MDEESLLLGHGDGGDDRKSIQLFWNGVAASRRDKRVTYERYNTYLKSLVPRERPSILQLSTSVEDEEEEDDEILEGEALANALILIDLCKESAKRVEVENTNWERDEDLPITTDEMLFRRACASPSNCVRALSFEIGCIRYSEFAGILESEHCCIEDLTIADLLSTEEATWIDLPRVQGFMRKLKRMTIRVNDSDLKQALYESLTHSASRIGHFADEFPLHPGEPEQLGYVLKVVKALPFLKSLCLFVYMDEDVQVNIPEVIELLGTVILEENGLEKLTISPCGSMRGLVPEYIDEDEWIENVVPIVRKSTTLISFAYAAENCNKCALVESMLARNRILLKLKSKSLTTLQEEILSGVQTKPRTRRQRTKKKKKKKPSNVIVDTIVKLASKQIEPTALYYYLQHNADRIGPLLIKRIMKKRRSSSSAEVQDWREGD